MTSFLVGHGFEGPSTWAEGAAVPYYRFLAPGIKVMISLSVITSENGYAVFDCGAVLFSKTLHELKRKAWPDLALPEKGSSAFAPCLTISLSNLKWRHKFFKENPKWAMTLAEDTNTPGAQIFLEDFKAFMLPLLEAIKSDKELEEVLIKSLDRSKPNWVLSNSSWFARLPELVSLLKDGTKG